MALSKQLQAAYNDQIQLEFASAYGYLAMVAWCESQGLAGFARWLRAQATEETQHALKFFDFVVERGGSVVLQAIEAPPADFASPLDVAERALAHEQAVTAAIGRLYGQATTEADYASLPLLNWFMTEQVEEEATVGQLVAELRMAGEDGSALLLLDRELGRRRIPAPE